MKASELVLAPDGSLYHIRLDAESLADRVILVGDPDRVGMIGSMFDSIEHESRSRELHAVTGRYHGQRLTALSTGMGCDNIDIVMTELDAALHVQRGRGWSDDDGQRRLKIVRVGTCGSLQAEAGCGSHVASRYAIGLDGLMRYYAEWDEPEAAMTEALVRHLHPVDGAAKPYCVAASTRLVQAVAGDMLHGITATAPGFYGPQGRTIRLHPAMADLNECLASFSWSGTPVVNLEMETSAIYGFSHMMHHEALTVCLVIANRATGQFLNEYHEPMRALLGRVMEDLAAL